MAGKPWESEVSMVTEYVDNLAILNQMSYGQDVSPCCREILTVCVTRMETQSSSSLKRS